MRHIQQGQKGYVGKSMSENAVKAFNFGEMPEDKWSRSAMLNAIEKHIAVVGISKDAMEYFKEMSRKELFNTYFEWKSWHHIGENARATDFYGLDCGYVDIALINAGYGLETFIKHGSEQLKNQVRQSSSGISVLDRSNESLSEIDDRNAIAAQIPNYDKEIYNEEIGER